MRSPTCQGHTNRIRQVAVSRLALMGANEKSGWRLNADPVHAAALAARHWSVRGHVLARTARWFATVLLAAIAGCGGGDFEDIANVFDCDTAPSISSAPGTTAYVGQQYLYAVTSVHYCGLLAPRCSGVVGLTLPAGAEPVGSSIFTWTPLPSQVNTDAFFHIATVEDACGNRAEQAWYVHVYPDTTPPTVTGVYPKPTATDVPFDTFVSVGFGEPIDPSSVDFTSFTVIGPAGPISGSLQVSGAAAIFTPDANLPGSSSISGTVTTAIKDLSGNALASDFTWTFTTAALPPAPPPGWTWSGHVGSPLSDATTSVSIALDNSDQVYLGVLRGAKWGGGPFKGRVSVSTNVSGSWPTLFYEEVAPDWYSFTGAPGSVSLLINSDATVHIAYWDYASRQIKHATNASGAWLAETVNPLAAPSGLSMTHDAASHLHLVYADQFGTATMTYATNKTGSWIEEGVGNRSEELTTRPVIAIDPAGNDHIAYYDSISNHLKHATNATGSWETELVDDQGNVGQHVSIAVDTSGYVHLSYYDADSGALRYATNASGAWITLIVDGAGDVGVGTSLAIDASGHVHIAYTDATNHALKYATNASGLWEAITVDDVHNVAWWTGVGSGYPSIAVDSANRVHIAYLAGNGGSWYATNR